MNRRAYMGIIAVVFLTSSVQFHFLERVLFWGDADTNDWKRFPAREIANRPPALILQDGTSERRVEQRVDEVEYVFRGRPRKATLFGLLEQTPTTAFIVLEGETVLFEWYGNGGARDSINTSFSAAKSFVSAMIGIAINEGKIGSVEDPLVKYVPELSSKAGMDKIRIRHLLMMCSGLRYKEGPPFIDGAMTYYYPDLRASALSAKPTEDPGAHFLYNNYNLLLLGLVLERATGQSVASYLQDRIWKPLGMEYPASWSLDSKDSGFEKMESGINARAIDYARFGLLFLRGGSLNNKRIVPEEWALASTRRDSEIEGPDYYLTRAWSHPGYYYKYLWWGHQNPGQDDDFFALGRFGQVIYVCVRKNLVLVRTGSDQGKVDFWPDVMRNVANRL